jgi:hypothetical protein
MPENPYEAPILCEITTPKRSQNGPVERAKLGLILVLGGVVGAVLGVVCMALAFRLYDTVIGFSPGVNGRPAFDMKIGLILLTTTASGVIFGATGALQVWNRRKSRAVLDWTTNK